MARLLIRNARVLTIRDQTTILRGAELGRLDVRDSADVVVHEGRVEQVVDRTGSAASNPRDDFDQTIEADGRVLLPAFVDCHTHACWAGNRLAEWEQKQGGATYLELLEAGGGIMSTVRAVREASRQQLSERLVERLDAMLLLGTTCVEVKSGYGLTTKDELKMLQAIKQAADDWPGQIAPTACLGHALDPDVDRKQLVQRTIEETLPAVTAEFPGITVDAYCEEGAWSLEECRRLFAAAAKRGHPIRVHADQFNSLGMIHQAVTHQYLSVDHLEASASSSLRELARSNTFGVVLPACGFHLDHRYADARSFVDAGGALALATNYNPGSAPCYSLPAVIAIAMRQMKLTLAEAISACTINAAALLGQHQRGTIAAGQLADLVLLRHRDERMLGFEFGDNPVEIVICRGVARRVRA